MTRCTAVECEAMPESLGPALERARAEFLEMPGLTLTVAQAARLWAVDPEISSAVLDALERAGFLVRTRHARFVRPH